MVFSLRFCVSAVNIFHRRDAKTQRSIFKLKKSFAICCWLRPTGGHSQVFASSLHHFITLRQAQGNASSPHPFVNSTSTEKYANLPVTGPPYRVGSVVKEVGGARLIAAPPVVSAFPKLSG